MYLNQQLLESCEEFFDQISNDEKNENLEADILSLRTFLEKDVDGFTNIEDEKLALATQNRLQEIWRLISKSEKNENQDLELIYQDLIAITEDVSDYDSDDIYEEADLEGDDL